MVTWTLESDANHLPSNAATVNKAETKIRDAFFYTGSFLYLRFHDLQATNHNIICAIQNIDNKQDML